MGFLLYASLLLVLAQGLAARREWNKLVNPKDDITLDVCTPGMTTNLKWLLPNNDTMLPGTSIGNIAVTNNGQLKITAVTNGDHGLYHCINEPLNVVRKWGVNYYGLYPGSYNDKLKTGAEAGAIAASIFFGTAMFIIFIYQYGYENRMKSKLKGEEDVPQANGSRHTEQVETPFKSYENKAFDENQKRVDDVEYEHAETSFVGGNSGADFEEAVSTRNTDETLGKVET